MHLSKTNWKKLMVKVTEPFLTSLADFEYKFAIIYHIVFLETCMNFCEALSLQIMKYSKQLTRRICLHGIKNNEKVE